MNSTVKHGFPGCVESPCSALSDSYQEIQSSLTQMESCMRLLSSDFEPSHLQPFCSSEQASQRQQSEEQPCCSKDLKEPAGGGQGTEGGEKTRGSLKEEEKTSGMEGGMPEGSDDERNTAEEKEEEEGNDVFIRSSGLITHTYSLDLEISPGNNLYFYIYIYCHTVFSHFKIHSISLNNLFLYFRLFSFTIN